MRATLLGICALLVLVVGCNSAPTSKGLGLPTDGKVIVCPVHSPAVGAPPSRDVLHLLAATLVGSLRDGLVQPYEAVEAVFAQIGEERFITPNEVAESCGAKYALVLEVIRWELTEGAPRAEIAFSLLEFDEALGREEASQRLAETRKTLGLKPKARGSLGGLERDRIRVVVEGDHEWPASEVEELLVRRAAQELSRLVIPPTKS